MGPIAMGPIADQITAFYAHFEVATRRRPMFAAAGGSEDKLVGIIELGDVRRRAGGSEIEVRGVIGLGASREHPPTDAINGSFTMLFEIVLCVLPSATFAPRTFGRSQV
jgi:hypothetical protein